VGGALGQQIGGGERVVLNQANFLGSRGHTVFLVAPGPLGNDSGEKIRRVQVKEASAGISRAFRLATAVRDTRPDVAVAHLGMRDMTAAIAGRVAPKLAIYSHGGPFLSEATKENRKAMGIIPSTTLFAIVYRAANVVMTNSDWCARSFSRHHIAVEVVYPGVDTGFFRPLQQSSARKELARRGLYRDELDQERKIFLNVGWFRRNKRHEVLIDALGELARFHPDAKVVFIGRGRGPGIEKYAAGKGLLSNIEFLDDVDDEGLRLWYCAATAYVHMNSAEHFGLPIAEAQSCGTPCLVPDRGGGAEIVEHERTGLFYASGDATSLSHQMRYCIEHPQEMITMGAAARSRVLSDFDQDVVNKKLEGLLISMKQS